MRTSTKTAIKWTAVGAALGYIYVDSKVPKIVKALEGDDAGDVVDDVKAIRDVVTDKGPKVTQDITSPASATARKISEDVQAAADKAQGSSPWLLVAVVVAAIAVTRKRRRRGRLS